MKPKPKAFRIWPLAMVVLLLLPAAHVGTAATNGSATVEAVIADPLSLLAMRSSGGRDIGTLAQSKPAYAPGDTPPGDFLGLLPEPDLPPEAGDFAPVSPNAPGPVSEVPPTLDQLAFLPPLGLDDVPQSGFFPRGSGGPVGNGFAIGGGGSAAGLPGTPGLLPALFQPLAPSLVPEPGSWLMIIVGFAAVGSALRSRNRRAVVGPVDAIGLSPTGAR